MGQFVPKPAFDLTRFLNEKAKPGAKRWGSISRKSKAPKVATPEAEADAPLTKIDPA